MTRKNILLTTTSSLIAVFSVAFIPNLAFAEEEKTGYKMADDDTHAIFTFTFKDGI